MEFAPLVDHLLQFSRHFERVVAVDASQEEIRSNRTLSRMGITQARNKSPTLGEETPPTGNQSLARQINLAKECLGKGMIRIRAMLDSFAPPFLCHSSSEPNVYGDGGRVVAVGWRGG
jgi:hypothetical protein